MARLLKVDGSVVEIRPRSPSFFTLEEMQKAVGGLIQLACESADGQRRCNLIVNEEGRPLRLPYNDKASLLFGRMLRGDVLQLTNKEWDQTFHPDEEEDER